MKYLYTAACVIIVMLGVEANHLRHRNRYRYNEPPPDRKETPPSDRKETSSQSNSTVTNVTSTVESVLSTTTKATNGTREITITGQPSAVETMTTDSVNKLASGTTATLTNATASSLKTTTIDSANIKANTKTSKTSSPMMKTTATDSVYTVANDTRTPTTDIIAISSPKETKSPQTVYIKTTNMTITVPASTSLPMEIMVTKNETEMKANATTSMKAYHNTISSTNNTNATVLPRPVPIMALNTSAITPYPASPECYDGVEIVAGVFLVLVCLGIVGIIACTAKYERPIEKLSDNESLFPRSERCSETKTKLVGSTRF